MLNIQQGLIFCFAALLAACSSTSPRPENQKELKLVDANKMIYHLPSPQITGTVSVEEALAQRRSRRKYQDRPISAEQLSQILWSAYGVTRVVPEWPVRGGGLRAAPSAGATYPLEVYALVGNVKGIETGVYRYIPDNHSLQMVSETDKRSALCDAALNQEMIEEAPASIFFSAFYEYCSERYGERCHDRYVAMDLGHAAQNVYLQAEALKLGTCAIGAFTDDKVHEVMELAEDEVPLYIMPIGYYILEE